MVLIPLDLTPLVQDVLSLGRSKRAEAMKKVHEKVRLHLENKNQDMARTASKGRKRIVLVPGDWVWVHLCKDRFPNHREN